MDKSVTTLPTKQQAVVDTIVYFLSVAIYAAMLHYWFDAPGWATFGIAVATAKIDAVGTSAARTRKRLGA